MEFPAKIGGHEFNRDEVATLFDTFPIALYDDGQRQTATAQTLLVLAGQIDTLTALTTKVEAVDVVELVNLLSDYDDHLEQTEREQEPPNPT